jgi:AcrR family transcriptional regulator
MLNQGRTIMGVTKESVIRTASDIADSDGLGGVSLKAVAERLGIRTPSLYNHIVSLDDLLRDAAHAGMRTMNESMTQASVGVSGLAALKAVGTAYFGYVISHPGIYEIIQWANWHGNDETSSLFGTYRALVARIVESFDLKGKKKDVSVNLALSVMHGYSTLNVGAAFANPKKATAGLTEALEIAFSGLSQR